MPRISYTNPKYIINMKKTLFLALAFLFSATAAATAAPKKDKRGEKAEYRIACIAYYNLENLFDTINDPNTNDEEFLPDGGMKWNSVKYNHKLKNMSEALSKLGTDEDPRGAAVIGVSEIENRQVLEDVCAQPAWGKRKMDIVHYDSPDRRGVDVGLLYDPTRFQVIHTSSHRLTVPNNPDFITRDQLVVSGYLLEMAEKIHIIVNHYPSKYGGEERSRPGREAAAALSKHLADSIFAKEPNAKIIICGDLNDDPNTFPTAEVIGAKKKREDVGKQGFYNCFWQVWEDRGIGSLYYNGVWNLYDQFIISEPLLNADPSKKMAFWKAQIFNKPFLTEQAGKNKGIPKRTHKSNVWTNGYSDHYPTMIYLIKKK